MPPIRSLSILTTMATLMRSSAAISTMTAAAARSIFRTRAQPLHPALPLPSPTPLGWAFPGDTTHPNLPILMAMATSMPSSETVTATRCFSATRAQQQPLLLRQQPAPLVMWGLTASPPLPILMAMATSMLSSEKSMATRGTSRTRAPGQHPALPLPSPTPLG
ncbi:MAG: hypothetical protein V7K75_13220 [Nostoc sp.]